MPAHHDAREKRDPEKREKALFAALRRQLEAALPRAPALRRQMGGIQPKELTGRAALARLPVLRKGDLTRLQGEAPPFAGLVPVKPGTLKRVLVSPGPIFEPEGHGADWWGAARALFAAGFRKGDLVHNSFSYHLTPGGHIMESGAHALGCAVIPAGVGNTEQQVEAIAALGPVGYTGTPDFLKVLLDRLAAAGVASPFRKALVSGAAFPPSLQREMAERGVEAFQAYAAAEFGVIAYETPARAGLTVNEELIVEIVRPGTGDPVPEGEIGEVVVTRIAAEYPLLRVGTGDLSRLLPGASVCGRTNMRLAGWMGRADQRTKIKGMFVEPGQMAEIGRRFPELGRLRLVVTREGEQDAMVLRAEAGSTSASLAEAVTTSLQAVTKLRGTVELVPPGSLPQDGKVVADERPVG